MPETDGILPELDRRLHRALVEGLLARGVIPAPADLAGTIGVTIDALHDRLAALAAADYLALDAAGRPVCLYPLSPVPTPHAVAINGQRRYAMCAIDALGMAAMLERSVTIEASCALCQAPISLAVAPGRISRAEPLETVVVARRSGDEPACQTCCPFTLFACDPAHGRELATRLPETSVLPLADALRHAETIFGDMLGATLPARRQRSQPGATELRT